MNPKFATSITVEIGPIRDARRYPRRGAGGGLTLLPRAILAPACAEGRIAVHDLPQSEAWVDTIFIRRRDGLVSSALAAFVEFAQRRLPEVRAA